jgi:hypothetical protein
MLDRVARFAYKDFTEAMMPGNEEITRCVNFSSATQLLAIWNGLPVQACVKL